MLYRFFRTNIANVHRAGVKARPLLFALGLSALCGCASIDRSITTPLSPSLPPAQSGPIYQLANHLAAERENPANSSFRLLPGAREAFDYRLALTDSATSTIDAQYFLWEVDGTGLLLLERLLHAADRGVRVRLLVDDILLRKADPKISALTHHPNVDIRIFNPNPARTNRLFRNLRLLFDLPTLNQRMHNKLFLVDGHIGIVGGRNIGDAYFGFGRRYNFVDLDILATGPVAAQMQQSFDQFWNSEAAFPGRALHQTQANDLEKIRRRLALELNGDPALSVFPRPVQEWGPLFTQIKEEAIEAPALFIADSPDPDAPRHVVSNLADLAMGVNRELLVATPYLIPNQEVLDIFETLSDRGVELRILVPSMAANNHTPVHSHYRKYRYALIRRGAELYEFRHEPGPKAHALANSSQHEPDFITFHMKAVLAGREQLFIGSLNLDPRAMQINTENGVLIDSPELGAQLGALFDTLLHPDQAWEVISLGPSNHSLYWRADEETRSLQPARSLGQRLYDVFARLLPIEQQL